MYFASFDEFTYWFELSQVSIDEAINITIYDKSFSSPLEVYESF